MKKTDKITIMGITGYTGAWLAKKLTDAGFTNIVGTYRNQAKMNSLKDQLPNITGIQADILENSEAVEQALVGSKWLFNNSAPFTGREKTIDDFVATKITAVNDLFKIIAKVGTIEKMVHLGSAAAIYMGIADPTKTIIDEDTWADLAQMDHHYEPFIDMKVAEEKRIDDLAQIMGLDVTVLHPTNIVGPSFTDWQHDMIYAYMHGNGPIVDGPLDCIDVRDIAGIEIALMNNDEASGKRVLGLGFTSTYHELEKTIQNNFDNKAVQNLFGKLPELIAPDLALKLWQPISYTSFYKDQAWRFDPKHSLQTKYPDFYEYQYTDATDVFKQAVTKMISNK